MTHYTKQLLIGFLITLILLSLVIYSVLLGAMVENLQNENNILRNELNIKNDENWKLKNEKPTYIN